MSENCSHDCSSCGENCSERNPKSFLEKPHDLSDIKNIIGVVSGKGGVGKSMVTSLLAIASQKAGYKTAILDADITGPSIPKAFGIDDERATADDSGLYPVKSASGIDIMSLNLLLENSTDPVVWRGPVIGGTVKQFWTDVIWGDKDFMFIDMPPGTGDVSLTVFQSIPIDGIIVVTSPQELVSMIVEKAVNMAKLMNIPILGIVENMSYVECPDCGKKINVFGNGSIEKTASAQGIDVIAKIPLMPQLAAACDEGTIEKTECGFLDSALDVLKKVQSEKK